MSPRGKQTRSRVFLEPLEIRMMLSGAAPIITAPEIFGVRPGTPFIFSITAAGDHPMTFSATGLPAGLSLNPQTGLITGTLGADATYDLSLGATNDAGAATQKFRIVVGDKLELTPVMGWNSWNVYQGKVTQAEVTAQANAMASSGLENYGWDYVNIDDGWEGGRAAPGSPIQSDPTVFPSIPALSSLIHSLGLKFGLYSVPQGTGYAHKAAGTAGQNTLPDALQMAAWGVDYFKYDGGPPTQQQIAELSQAFQSSGRDIILSASYFSGFSTANGNSTFLPEFTNSWRVNGDITDFFTTVLNAGIADEQPWLNYSGPGHWLDPDALEIGYVGNGQAPHPSGMTQNQQQAQLTIWAMDAAPLLLGSDLTQLTPATLSILTDPEVIAVDQDPLGIQSRPVNGNTSIQSRPLADGSTAVELVNWSTGPTKMSVNFSDLGINGPQAVRDLLAQQNVGTFSGSYTVTVPAGATALIKLTAATPGAPQISDEPVNDEVNVGSPATFTVAASGAGTLSYQWTENGVNIPGANSATLITSPTTAADDGAAFRCVVTNSIGKIISYEADLNLHGLTTPLTSTSYISASSGYYNNTVNQNANVLGYPLNINGTTFTNGLGTQSPSEIDYFLNGQDSLFQTSVGIDNNGAGAVYFEVWLDGVEAYTTGLVTAHQAAIPISVNVTGAHELQLIVANGGTTTAGGNSDWINPRVTSSLIGPQLPSVNNISKTIQVNTTANFSASDFTTGFIEPNPGDSLQSITITSLATSGNLLLSGSSVTAQQVIPTSQIGNLSYVPAANFTGADNFAWLGTDQFGSAIAPAAVNLTVQAVVIPPPPPAPVGNGISFPTGFASAGNTLKLNGSAAITNGTIVLTNNTKNNASSVYFTTPQSVAKFTTTFNFQITGTWPIGDGFTFVMQNAGLTALGPSGGGMGYGASQAGGSGGISSSVAVKFDVFFTSSGNGAIGVISGGAFPGGSGADLGGSGFNLRSYDPNQATISYDGTTLTVTLTDLTTKATVTRSFAINIPANVGGTSAFVGFTGADGTLVANQIIQNWSFTPGSTTPIAPVPQLPSVNSFSKSTIQNSAASFSAADFSAAFVEPNSGDSLQSIQISSLPANGALLLSGNPVTAQQIIPISQIANLSYVPAANFSGGDTFSWLGTDQVGSAIAPALVNLTIQPVVQAPGTPQNLTAVAGDGQVTLKWNSAAGATSYSVSYGTTNNGPYGTTAQPVTGTTQTITGLSDGTTYYFVVSAANSAGPSTNSAQASATPVAPLPPPPPPSTAGISFPTGFASAGNALTLNGSAKVTNGAIVLTNNTANNDASVYFTTPQNVARFTTTFNFQITGTWPLGDGFTFVMQNAGLNALGASGSGLGYGASQAGGTGGIPNSVAVKFDFFHTSSGNGAVGVYSAGAYPGNNGSDLGGSGFNLRSYDPSQATISYDGTTLSITLTDLLTHATVSRSFAVNIPALVGSSSAYVGFTGGDGSLVANQLIQNWTFTGAPAAPANVIIAAGNQQAALTWNPVPGAATYNIRYGTTAGGPYPNLITGILQTSDTVLSLTSGTTYFFIITAVNAAGESVGSAQVSGTA